MDESQDSQSKIFHKYERKTSRMKRSTLVPIRNLRRKRAFEFNLDGQHNLFEGVALVQYDKFIRCDRGMQIVVTRDLLKILQDKCIQLKLLLGDTNKIRTIFKYTSYTKRVNLNEKLEETLGMMIEISKTIMNEFKNNMAELGI